MQSRGAGDPKRYIARLVGGAQILTLGGSGKLPRIGDQNSLAVQEALKSSGIALKATDLGGSKGRSVWFNPHEGGRNRGPRHRQRRALLLNRESNHGEPELALKGETKRCGKNPRSGRCNLHARARLQGALRQRL